MTKPAPAVRPGSDQRPDTEGDPPRPWPAAVTRAPLTARTAAVAAGVAGPIAVLLFLAAILLRGPLPTLAFVVVSLVFGWLVLLASPALPRRPRAEVARVVFATAAAPLTGLIYAPILLRAANRWRPGTAPRARPPMDRTRALVAVGVGAVMFLVLTAITVILPVGGVDADGVDGVVPTPSAPGSTTVAAATEVGVPGTAIEGSYAAPSRSASFTPADGFARGIASCGQQIVATADGTIGEVTEQLDGTFQLVILGDDGLAHVYGLLGRVQPSGQQGLQVQAGNPIAAPSVLDQDEVDGEVCTLTYAITTPEAVQAGGYRTRIDPIPYLEAWLAGDSERSPVDEVLAPTGGSPSGAAEPTDQ